ncbi:MAG: hypothetical protein Kow00127_22460 [Bacteroidales bacterium]
MKANRFISLFFLLITAAALGQELPERPNRLVNDFAGVLSSDQSARLERKLVAINDTNSTQIAILIIPDLNGYDITDYGQRVAQKWGIGQGKYDNGVLIVVKPKTATQKGEADIEVGYGLEPLIPDITARRIIEQEMIPWFRENDYYTGLDRATNVIMSLAAGKFTADAYSGGSGNGSGGLFVPILIMMIVIFIIRASRNGPTNLGGGQRRGDSGIWTALFLASMMGGGRGGSGFGGGGFGGSGGGFGGFGGGSFGGGGASGSW